jgi:hypothetical protein
MGQGNKYPVSILDTLTSSRADSLEFFGHPQCASPRGGKFERDTE